MAVYSRRSGDYHFNHFDFPEPGSSPVSAGRTALFWAAKNGNEKVVQILIEKEAGVQVKDQYVACGSKQRTFTGDTTIVATPY